MNTLKYKHIYKKTIKHKYGQYEYYMVQLRSTDSKLTYIGCSRKYAIAECLLLEYAKANGIQEESLLKD
jgi:hypothetical protein